MRGDDADFAAYLTARWASLVRSLVLLGCDLAEAAEVAEDGLAHCYADWERVRRGADVDAHVWTAVLDRLRHRRRHAPAAPRPVVDDPSELVRLRLALEAQLDALAPEAREVVVLRFAGGLDDVQVAEVLDVPVATARHRVADALAAMDLAALQELAP